MTTIDRGFSQISSPPRSPPTFTPSCIQLHLMRPSGITSWTQLLHCQYNYTLTAKLPTQRKCVPTESLQRHILQPKVSIFDVAASNN